MKSSSNDLYTSGDYLLNNPDWNAQDGPWKASMIAEMMKKNNIIPEKIVDVGCGSGWLLKKLSENFPTTAQFIGYDISAHAISLAKKWESERIHFFEGDFLDRSDKCADLLLAIDVIEHIDDFYGFLRKSCERSQKYIFHIPLDLSARTLLKPHVMLQQRDISGHIHYFSTEMVWWALRDTGYQIIDWRYTKPRIDLDAASGFKRGVKKILRNFSFSINRDLSVKLWGGYSVLILAQQG